VGIAMGSTLAAWLNAAMLGVTLARRGFYSPDDRLKRKLPRVVFSGLMMGAILLVGFWFLRANFAETARFMASLWGLLALVLGGIASYFALAHFSGAMTLGELKAAIKR
jgi:putative peptidoglycan lipid II flippase